MKVKALRDFSSTTSGNVSAGDVIEVNTGYARHLVENGLAERVDDKPAKAYKTKVETPTPETSDPLSDSAGSSPGKLSGASRPARRSRKRTAKNYGDNE